MRFIIVLCVFGLLGLGWADQGWEKKSGSGGGLVDYDEKTGLEAPAEGRSVDGASVAWSRKSSAVRDGVGLWTVTLSSAHPNGDEWKPIVEVEEDAVNRDGVIVNIVEGSQTATAFQVQFLTGDNSTTADIRVDAPFYWCVHLPCPVLVAGAAAAVPLVEREAEDVQLLSMRVQGADIHDAGIVVDLAATRTDAGWGLAGNVATYTGAPDRVEGDVCVNAPDAGASSYWARPKLRISRGGVVIAVIDDLVMQQTGAYDGDATMKGTFIDEAPGANPAYTLEWFDQDARTATLPPNIFSRIHLKAVEVFPVFSSQAP